MTACEVQIVELSAHERRLRWALVLALSAGWLALVILSQMAVPNDDVNPPLLMVVASIYIVYSVPRAMRRYELRHEKANWKGAVAVVAATAGVAYLELYMLLLAWKPATVSPEMVATVSAYFAPLDWVLGLFGVRTWMSI